MHPYHGKLVKISRYGESFWLRDVREVAPDVFVGTVDNRLMEWNLFGFGDQVAFVRREVGDVCDHLRPQLTVVAETPERN